MLKKPFFHILITLSVLLTSSGALYSDEVSERQLSVDLITVSSSFDERKVQKIKDILEGLGMRVYTRFYDQTISDFGYVNLEENRINSLVNALKAKDSDFVWFLRGGAGAIF